MSIPYRQIRAAFDADTLTVYQAYAPAIAAPAVAAQTFVAPFKRERMTWIKPSFLWMMYRCGWATKPGQERVLAIRITRSGFESGLRESCLSHFDPELHASHDEWRARLATSPVRLQWDPERDRAGQPLAWRSLQLGLSGSAVTRYVEDWIVGIDDITDSLADRRSGAEPLPTERPYPLPDDLVAHIGAS